MLQAAHEAEDSAERAQAPGAPAGGWACATCTFRNGAADAVCSVCGARAQGSAGQSPAPHTAPATVPAPAARAPCGNAACRNRVSRRGDAAAAGLCSSCFADAVLGKEDSAARAKHLVPLYHHQLAAGCGDPLCRNSSCRTGARALLREGTASPRSQQRLHRTAHLTANEAAARALELAAAGAQDPPSLALCVRRVPTQAPAAAEGAAPASAEPQGQGRGARRGRGRSRGRGRGRGGALGGAASLRDGLF